jgi:hypothetical protein
MPPKSESRYDELDLSRGRPVPSDVRRPRNDGVPVLGAAHRDHIVALAESAPGMPSLAALDPTQNAPAMQDPRNHPGHVAVSNSAAARGQTTALASRRGLPSLPPPPASLVPAPDAEAPGFSILDRALALPRLERSGVAAAQAIAGFEGDNPESALVELRARFLSAAREACHETDPEAIAKVMGEAAIQALAFAAIVDLWSADPEGFRL